VADAPEGAPKLYDELADWFHLLTPPSDYADEAAIYRRLLDAAGPVTSVLEFGSGGGNNASHLQAHYAMTLVDVSERMLALSRRINPNCEHITGDMRSARLGRQFDAVFIHDAIDYMVSLDDLRAAMATAYVHLRLGGVALLCPDHLRDTFQPMTVHGGHDAGGRGLRFLEWTWDPDPADTTYTSDYAYLLREGAAVRAVHDRHVCGLFTRADWRQALADTGFRDVEVRPGADGLEVFTAIR
jgi:SAM-dependent methyltransferase